MSNILEVDRLNVSVKMKKMTIDILRDISFDLEKGKWLGVIGSSGAGKSTLAYAISNMILDKSFLIKGHISFLSQKNVLELSPKARRQCTLENLGIIFQNAMSCLDPYETIEKQLLELIYFKKNIKNKEAIEVLNDSLKKVGLDKEKNCIYKYPSQLSGGMRQRVILAMSVIQSPRLLIADEPTSSLDGIHKLQFMRLLKKISNELNISVVYISHDISLVAEFCDELLFLNKGKIAEHGSCQQLLKYPKNDLLKKIIADTKCIIGDGNECN